MLISKEVSTLFNVKPSFTQYSSIIVVGAEPLPLLMHATEVEIQAGLLRVAATAIVALKVFGAGVHDIVTMKLTTRQ